MRRNPLVTSRFRSVYIGLLCLFAASILGLHVLTVRLVRPWLENFQLADIESLVRSHNEHILYNDTRALRDELVARHIISSDLNFSILKPSRQQDKAVLAEHLNHCVFLRSRSCLGSEGLLIVDSDSNDATLASANYAIWLETRFPFSSKAVIAGEIGAAIILAIVFLFIGFGIRSQERFLLGKISLLMKSLENVEKLFIGSAKVQGGDLENQDEFSSASQTVAELGEELKRRAQAVFNYKEQFERKTRLEQLGLTVGQVSHDLKAPLNEADQFLTALPELIGSIPNKQLIEMSDSLRERISYGKKALDKALKTTSVVATATEKIDLGEFIKTISDRYNAQIGGSGFRVLNDLPEGKGLHIAGDRRLLERAFLNLIQNSSEARTDGTLTITAAPHGANSIFVSLVDNGPGIQGQYLEKIFEPLVTFKPSGTGFGLSSCKEIVEQCRGSIQALPCASGAYFEMIFPKYRNENNRNLGVEAYA